jgi:hypothetical protein
VFGSLKKHFVEHSTLSGVCVSVYVMYTTFREFVVLASSGDTLPFY